MNVQHATGMTLLNINVRLLDALEKFAVLDLRYFNWYSVSKLDPNFSLPYNLGGALQLYLKVLASSCCTVKDCHKVFLTSFVGWLLLEEFSPALLLLLLILQRSVCLQCQTTAEIWRSRLCYLLYCVIPRCLKSTDRLQQRAALLLPAFWCIAEAENWNNKVMKKFVHLMKITIGSRSSSSTMSGSSSWLLMVVLLAATAPSIVSSGKCIEQQKEEEALDAHLKVFSTLCCIKR